PSPKFGRRGWGMRVYFFSYRKNYSFQGGRGLQKVFHLISSKNPSFGTFLSNRSYHETEVARSLLRGCLETFPMNAPFDRIN
ncbi:hypothetical protein, partial [Nostoc commune]|uniref:hypothetical protein n=1 Tax=Nostoc commune TaxID=1178 RepID=UPI001E32241A